MNERMNGFPISAQNPHQLLDRLLCCCLVAKSVWLFCDSMDCSLLHSSVHGLSQTRKLEWVAISFPLGIFPIQGSNSCFLHCRQILYHWVTREAPDLLYCPTNILPMRGPPRRWMMFILMLCDYVWEEWDVKSRLCSCFMFYTYSYIHPRNIYHASHRLIVQYYLLVTRIPQ